MLSEAIAFYNQNEFVKALPIFQKLANEKNSEAQFYLGMMYENGEGVFCNIETAKNWYRKASRGRNPDADFRLQSIDQKTNCRC
jgi:TPR repeat protein